MASQKVGTDFVFLVIGPYCFGKAKTEKEAIKNARENAPQRELKNGKLVTYAVYLVPPDAGVDGLGRITWDDGKRSIILIRKVKDGKETEIGESD